MKIAVVILNWNGKDLLQKYLPDVVRNSKKPIFMWLIMRQLMNL